MSENFVTRNYLTRFNSKAARSSIVEKAKARLLAPDRYIELDDDQLIMSLAKNLAQHLSNAKDGQRFCAKDVINGIKAGGIGGAALVDSLMASIENQAAHANYHMDESFRTNGLTIKKSM